MVSFLMECKSLFFLFYHFYRRKSQWRTSRFPHHSLTTFLLSPMLDVEFMKEEFIISQLTLAKAKEILPKYTTEDHLFTHAMAVSAAMGAMADYFHADKDHW